MESEEEFKEAHRRLLGLFSIQSGLLIVLFGVCLRLIGHFAFLGQNSLLGDLVRELSKEIGNFLLATFAIAFFFEFFIRQENERQIRHQLQSVINDVLHPTLRRVYTEGRPSIEEKAKYISEAKYEVIEIGTALRTFISYFRQYPDDRYRAFVVDRLKHGVDFICLLVEPTFAEQYDAEVSGRVRVQLAELEKLQNELNADGHKGKFLVRLYQQIPCFAAIMIDCGISDSDGLKEMSEGKIIWAPYMYHLNNSESPHFAVYQSESPLVYNKFRRSVRALYKVSLPTAQTKRLDAVKSPPDANTISQ